ncbi:ADP-ribosyltransferase [uncultured Legionella sp.]|uniref:ADP-ribosyltransferase n=1 Tax=uncultured Legionella sp. TaxID=210934 RepID=UPI002620E104|nr:ADP-ribosyltransferase [uncultured Legionella sp.]
MNPIKLNLNKDFVATSSQLGSNKGGFFKKKSDGSEYYIKWLPASDKKNLDRLKNEYLALKLYELFGVAVPKAELFTFTDAKGVQQVGIITAKKEGIAAIKKPYQNDPVLFEQIRQKAQQDFLIDALIANYDVVGLDMDNLHYNTTTGEPFRIDPGGALRYKAQGEDKWKIGLFDDKADEFEDMASDEAIITKYKPHVLFQAREVFKGVYQSPALQIGLQKLHAVSEEQIRACINNNFYDPNTAEGKEANEKMITILLARKQSLIKKAEHQIALHTTAAETKSDVVVGVNSFIPQDIKAVKAIVDKPIISAIKDIKQRVVKLEQLALKEPAKYSLPYQEAKQLHDNLERNFNNYKANKIDDIAFYGLNKLQISKTEPILEHLSQPQEGGWRKGLASIKQAFNRFFSFLGLASRSFENELADFRQKSMELQQIPEKQDPEDMTISPEGLVELYPYNKEVIAGCYEVAPSCLKKADPDTILELVNKEIVPLTDAVQTFPEHEGLVKKAYTQKYEHGIIKTEKKLIDLINKKSISPADAVKEYPKNTVIIETAYKLDPTSIKHADHEAINKLGESNVIKTADVLTAFSMSMPSSGEQVLAKAQFDSAMTKKDWKTVVKICDKFWFEKPGAANKEKIVKKLVKNQQWDDLYRFEQHFKKEDYQLTAGPLMKKDETTQLEDLFRKMMADGNFTIQNINGEDHFVFSDGTQFNWTRIQANADLQHIDLNPADMGAYRQYMQSGQNIPAAYSTLNVNQESKYRKRLYTDPHSGKPIAQPNPPLSFQEMQALNVYTGGFYEQMNGLMRNEPKKFDYKTGAPEIVRAALIHSVMAGSGLRKVPTTDVPESYRGASMGSDAEQQQRIEAAAKKGVVELNGFVSSAIDKKAAFGSKPVAFTFKNLRGAYIAAISKVPHEKEYLIPQTQVQISSYKYEDGKHKFEASLVSDVFFAEKATFKPMIMGKNQEAINFASPRELIALIDEGFINPINIVKDFSNNKDIVAACCNKDLTVIPTLPIPLVAELTVEGKIPPLKAVSSFPVNEQIIYLAYKIDPLSIKVASSEKIIELVDKGIILADDAVKAFPEDEQVIIAAHKNNPSSMSHVPLTKITELMNKAAISLIDAVKAFPDNNTIITQVYKKDPAAIGYASPDKVAELMNKGVISIADGIKIFPDNNLIISAAYKIDPKSIKQVLPYKVLDLMDKGIIALEDAVKAFPNNEAIVNYACNRENIRLIETAEELIDLINQGVVSPANAIEHYPKNAGVIEAAYKKDPSAIKYADIETINQLGQAKIIKAADVLSAFAIKMPSNNEKSENEIQFHKAMANKDWPTVARICDKFWFEKPDTANKSAIASQLTQDKKWEDLFHFEKAFKNDVYQLSSGSLRKTPETDQLEELLRKMMTNGNFTIQNINGDDRFVFTDGTQFNWTKIQANADLQHLELTPHDMESYKQFLQSGQNPYSAQSTLDASQESEYRAQLYTDPNSNKAIEQPNPPLSFQEMQAINTYTGGFYEQMNGLMRNDPNKFDYKTGDHKTLRAALIHSVMAGSGLRKVHTTDIPVSYRGASMGSKEEQQQRIEAATRKGVIELNGFISTATDSSASFNSKPIIFTFTDLVGAYIAPISKYPDEKEYLMPQTQVQISSYKYENGKHKFEANVVSDAGFSRKAAFEPMKISPTNVAIRFADPQQIINLINKDSFSPKQAIQIFPTDNDIISAVCHKAPDLIKELPVQQVVTLVNERKIDPLAATKAFPDNKQVVLASYHQNKEAIKLASSTLLTGLENKTSKQSSKNSADVTTLPGKSDILDSKLFKIQNAYQRSGEPPEELIKDTLKKACQTTNFFGISKMSTNTNNAKHLINKIKDSPSLCQAFGIDATQSESHRVSEIKNLMTRANTNKPLYPENQSTNEKSTGARI